MKIMSVVGARPQFVKAAAVSLALRQRAGEAPVEEIVVHTGQHYDRLMSDVFFEELVIPTPAFDLAVGSARHGQQTADVMARLEPLVLEVVPDVVVVYGDTNSTLGAALVAAKQHVPLAHVEAGLRSFDKRMPEEVNRVLTDHVSDLLLCPSRQSIDNLAREGITGGVEFTGDVMHGVLWRTLTALDGRNPIPERLGIDAGDYVVVTMHRASNTDDPARARAVVDALEAIAGQGLHVVFPVHPRATSLLAGRREVPRLHILEPLAYREMVALTSGARAVVTDSGGLQKEAVWLGVPCVTIRDETEWVETVAAGWNVLVGTDTERIVDAVLHAEPRSEAFVDYGGSEAADEVVAAIVRRFAG